ncbi:MAG: hypothetical protein ACPG7F_17095 [Aggregatilineales bacterium]
MDLNTFLTTLYVWIDDWYSMEMAEQMKRRHGPRPKMSDAEVITVAIAGQWHYGMPWQSERGVVRYMQAHGRGWFPGMLERSRFNERVRDLWAVIIKVQQALVKDLPPASEAYEVVDCVPLPACSKSQAKKQGHWLWWGTWGHGGTNSKMYWGDQAIVSVRDDYAIMGWLLGPARADDRALLQILLSQRAGQPAFHAPEPWRPHRRMYPPAFVGPLLAAGIAPVSACYLADKGFCGYRWQQHWFRRYGTTILTPPKRDIRTALWSRSWGRWLSGMRQKVETCFAVLTQVFSIKRLNAHSRRGQQVRFALATAAFNWGLHLNRCMERPALSHATLIT